MQTAHRDFYDCSDRITANPPMRRSDFARFARYVRTEQPLENLEDIPTLRAVGRCMAWRWVGEGRACPLCGAQVHLGMRAREAAENGDRARTIVWRGPSPKAARVGESKNFGASQG